MILRTLIIDDEPLAHDVILTFAQDVPFIKIVGQYYSATEALTLLNTQPIDLIFLDIQMPILTGIELLNILPHKPEVIITSAYQEYALQGYELDVTDYLLKPFLFERFLLATNKAFARVSLKQKPQQQQVIDIEHQTNVQAPSDPSQDHILIKVDRKQIRVALSEISCLEAYGNYVKVWRQSNCLLTPNTLTAFTDILPSNDFIRVHKSAIINKAYVDYTEDNGVYLKDGRRFPIGKQHRLHLKQSLS